MYVNEDAYTYKTDSLVDALARVSTDTMRDIHIYIYICQKRHINMSKEKYIHEGFDRYQERHTYV